MVILDGVRYYTKKEVAEILGVSPQTIQLYFKWSKEREEKGEARFIPAPKRLENGYKVWNDEQIEQIREFRESIERGDLADYSKQQWYHNKKAEEQKV